VDLLVVMETHKGELETALEISDALPRLAFKVDVVMRSGKAIKRRIEIGDRFMAEITQKGKVLYAREYTRLGQLSITMTPVSKYSS
jgi:hypothetical protein